MLTLKIKKKIWDASGHIEQGDLFFEIKSEKHKKALVWNLESVLENIDVLPWFQNKSNNKFKINNLNNCTNSFNGIQLLTVQTHRKILWWKLRGVVEIIFFYQNMSFSRTRIEIEFIMTLFLKFLHSFVWTEYNREILKNSMLQNTIFSKLSCANDTQQEHIFSRQSSKKIFLFLQPQFKFEK